MPKLKSNKSAAKRFKVSGSGKFMRWHACKSHILTKKSRKRKRNLREDTVVQGEHLHQMKRLLPYLA